MNDNKFYNLQIMMNAVIDTNASLTVEEAILKTTSQLNEAMVRFDRWATRNPQFLNNTNTEFKLRKNEIKLLRLRINELNEMQKTFKNTLLMIPQMEEFITQNQYTKPRNTEVTNIKPTMKTGERKGIKISKN